MTRNTATTVMRTGSYAVIPMRWQGADSTQGVIE